MIASPPLRAVRPHDGPSDESLLERFADDGDRAALDALISRHLEAAYRLALRIVGNPADAEDAVQTAFVRMMRHARTRRSGSLVRPWLSAIVVNACRTQRQRRA